MDDPPDIPAKIRPDIFKLNEDCLAKILTYLKLEDVLKFASVDERFNQAVQLRSTNYDDTVINDAFLTLPGISRQAIDDALDAISRRATRLKLVIADELRFRETVCHFRHLRDLTLIKVCLSGVKFDILPDKLERLMLTQCETKNFQSRCWFKRLNPTLKTLEVESVLNGLDILDNLTHLKIFEDIRAIEANEKPLLDALRNNKNLKSLDLWLLLSYIRLEHITHLDQLEYLQLDISDFDDFPDEIPNIFPNIQTIDIYTEIDDSLNLFLNKLSCEDSLTTLLVEGRFKILHDLRRFKNLNRIRLRGLYNLTEFLVDQLRSMERLTHLEIETENLEKVGLVKRLPCPSLMELKLNFSNDFSHDLKTSMEDEVAELREKFPFLSIQFEISSCLLEDEEN